MMTEKIGRGYKRATDSEVVEAYRETGSVWKAAKVLGLAGQTVHERLIRLGFRTAHANWTADEDEELAALFSDPHLTISEVAARLNRTSASISCRAGEIGIRKAKLPKHKRIPRGRGYDKASILRHIRRIEVYEASLTKYCRANSMSIEVFAQAVQKNYPEWWSEYVKTHSDLEYTNCKYCDESFLPNNKRQEFCSRKCSSDSRRDRDYFGGKRSSGIGVRARICQLCGKYIETNLHVHHIYGKTKDIENEYLVALCGGCHMLVEQLSINKVSDNERMIERLLILVWKKRNGWENRKVIVKYEVNKRVIDSPFV